MIIIVIMHLYVLIGLIILCLVLSETGFFSLFYFAILSGDQVSRLVISLMLAMPLSLMLTTIIYVLYAYLKPEAIQSVNESINSADNDEENPQGEDREKTPSFQDYIDAGDAFSDL